MDMSLKNTWTQMVQPLLTRPNRVQVAALCTRIKNGGKQVLLITSRDTGRWILPKGWPIDGLDAADAALQEAWEEAGVKPAKLDKTPIGTYTYDKTLDSGAPVPVTTYVFEVDVASLADTYPEVDERTRTWVTPAQAVTMVDESGLQDLLSRLS